MDKAIKFYQIPNDFCSCRDKNGDPIRIGRNYRFFFEKLSEGKNGAECLDELGITRSCCRVKYLCLANEPMIDRSSERFIDTTVVPNIRVGTRDLYPGIEPPDFPIL